MEEKTCKQWMYRWKKTQSVLFTGKPQSSATPEKYTESHSPNTEYPNKHTEKSGKAERPEYETPLPNLSPVLAYLFLEKVWNTAPASHQIFYINPISRK